MCPFECNDISNGGLFRVDNIEDNFIDDEDEEESGYWYIVRPSPANYLLFNGQSQVKIE